MHAMKRSIAAAIAVAVLSGTAALSGCATSSSALGARGGPGHGGASGTAGGGAGGQAVSFAPVIASMPPGAGATRPAATTRPTTAPAPSASAGQPGSGTGNGTTGGSCQHPVFTTSDPQGGSTLGAYYIANDMWNASNYSVSQTMHACSAANWYVIATMNNDNGDGAVKTFPNAHMDFGAAPAIGTFHSVSSSFTQPTNPGGIYEYAYDIWINGIASSGSTEVMIWTDNHGQRPAGSVVATATIGGQGFQVWKNGNYIAFAADQNVDSGTVNLLRFFDFVIGKGWLASSATLNQVDYGIELVSTSGVPETFSVTNFSVTTS
jgi:hypothetical protein